MKSFFLIAIITIILAGCNTRTKTYPVGIKFYDSTITRKGYYGDNCCQTWASDGNIYTMMDDGNGWWGSIVKDHDEYWGSMCIRIICSTGQHTNILRDGMKRNLNGQGI